MKKRIFAALLSALVLLTASGCGAARKPDDGRLQVVCSLFPYYDFVRAIGGEYVAPTLLIPAGRETHSFEPTPLDVIEVAEADVFIYNGGEGEFWVSEILGAAGENISEVVCMMDHIDALEEEIVEGMQGHDHDHGHDHEADAAAAFFASISARISSSIFSASMREKRGFASPTFVPTLIPPN